jgi:hypothetical protein
VRSRAPHHRITDRSRLLRGVCLAATNRITGDSAREYEHGGGPTGRSVTVTVTATVTVTVSATVTVTVTVTATVTATVTGTGTRR